MTPEEFRLLGHEVIDWIADYRESLPARHVQATALPGEVRQQIPTIAPLLPESLAEILEDLDRIVMPGLSHFQHPRFTDIFRPTRRWNRFWAMSYRPGSVSSGSRGSRRRRLLKSRKR